MEHLVIDCSGGARKGQLVDALLELLDEEQRAAFVRAFNAHGVAGTACELDGDGRFVVLESGRTEAEARRGFSDGRAHGEGHGDGDEHAHSSEHAHEHRSLADVHRIVDAAGLPDGVVRDVNGVYAILADAEARAHGTDVASVHFHEVGNAFAIGTIAAFCMLMGELEPKRISATPIACGFGFVDCAHGRLPIPAPATANILAGMPHRAGEVEGELCTPTGAAIVRYFAEDFVE